MNNSRPAHKNIHFKAFTLAEVLITLGIIGVVAAMTIPVLSKNNQQKELKTAFKKSYSMLYQALQQTTQENGGMILGCYGTPGKGWVGNECGEFWKTFKTKLKINKNYTGAVNGTTLPDYMGTEFVIANGGSANNPSCNGGVTTGKGNKEAYILSDGSNIISYYNIFDSIGLFILDTNGLRKPNKWGYDLFMLNFQKNTDSISLTISDDMCGYKEKGGYSIKELLQN